MKNIKQSSCSLPVHMETQPDTPLGSCWNNQKACFLETECLGKQGQTTRSTPAHQPPPLEGLLPAHSQQGQGDAARYSQCLKVATGDACFLCPAINHKENQIYTLLCLCHHQGIPSVETKAERGEGQQSCHHTLQCSSMYREKPVHTLIPPVELMIRETQYLSRSSTLWNSSQYVNCLELHS